MKWIALSLVVAFLALSIWTAYANVLSDDTEVRDNAEFLARRTAGCDAECKLLRLEGSRGVLATTLDFRFSRGSVTVTCKRPYIAFGSYGCTATPLRGPGRP